MDGLWQDLRLALRALWKSPFATGVAMACLALGIGTNATMFSVVSGTLLNPLPFRDPDQLITVRGTQHENGINRAGLSFPDLRDYQESSRAVASLAGVASRSLTFSDTDEPERVQGAAVSWQLFSMIGIAPALGRDFTAADDRPGAAAVVLLSDELWRRRYNADPAIVGRAVTINARPYTVIGVLPPRVKFPFLQVAWVPLAPLLDAEPRQIAAARSVRAARARAHARSGARGAGRHRGAAGRDVSGERRLGRAARAARASTSSRPM